MNMRNIDFSPLYRTTVGFDHLSSLLNNIHSSDTNTASYPPYNIELIDDNQYQITMAISGFDESELSIQSENQLLTIKSQKSDQEANKKYLHQGIAARNFERRFQLADHVEVRGASLTNGLLYIDLAKIVPDAMKPKFIPIRTGNNKLVDVSKSNTG